MTTQEIKIKRNYSQPFKDFILALQAWIEEGCPQGKPFRNQDSVCFQPRHFAKNLEQVIIVEKDLSKALRKTVCSDDTPFNVCAKEYEEEMDSYKHYQNPKRLEWIKAMADQFKAEVNREI